MKKVKKWKFCTYSIQSARIWLAISLHFWSTEPILMNESRIDIMFNWSLKPFMMSTKHFILWRESSRIPSKWTRQMYCSWGLLFTLLTISIKPLITSDAYYLLAVVESSNINLYCSASDPNIHWPIIFDVPALTPVAKMKNQDMMKKIKNLHSAFYISEIIF